MAKVDVGEMVAACSVGAGVGVILLPIHPVRKNPVTIRDINRAFFIVLKMPEPEVIENHKKVGGDYRAGEDGKSSVGKEKIFAAAQKKVIRKG